MLIGISGYIGSGKDLVAKMIQYHIVSHIMNSQEEFRNDSSRDYSGSGWEVKKFAGKLKQIVSLLTGIPIVDLEKQEVKDSELGPEWAFWRIQHYVGSERVGEPIGKFTSLDEAREKEKQWRISYQWPDTLKSSICHLYPNVRWLLQTLGTDAMRDVIHPNIHVNALFADYKPKLINVFSRMVATKATSSDAHVDAVYPNWLISDMRFPNEMEAVKQRGGITVRVNRKYVEYPLPDGGTAKVTAYVPGFDAPKHPSETSLDSAEFDYVIENNEGIPELLEQVKQMLIHFNLI